MKKLSKAQQKELSEHVAALREKMGDIDDAFEKLEGAISDINNAIDEYNGVVVEVTEWRDGLVGDMETYQGERSDKWQEGDAGQAYQAWLDEWQGLEIEEIEQLDLPEQPVSELADHLEDIPVEAETA